MYHGPEGIKSRRYCKSYYRSELAVRGQHEVMGLRGVGWERKGRGFQASPTDCLPEVIGIVRGAQRLCFNRQTTRRCGHFRAVSCRSRNI